MAGLRVKSTPVPESTLRLPKTMACTVTAVPRSSGIPSCSRYARARSLFQERKTASTAARSCVHGSSGTVSTPTMSRNMASKRFRQLPANLGLPEDAASPAVVASLRPRLRIVSIIPGIEIGAPDRTLTSSGFAGSPKPWPTSCSMRAMWARSSSSRPAGQPCARYSLQAPVVTVKAGGTGSPRSTAMTMRFAAFPPTSRLTSGKVRPSWRWSQSWT